VLVIAPIAASNEGDRDQARLRGDASPGPKIARMLFRDRG
jgi:hypothetical protein